jgi:hypothetical protein
MSDAGVAREPLWEQLDRAETYRLRLFENGYIPLPCVGKVPTTAGWQQFIPTVDDIKDWKKYCTNAVNTGLLTAHNPVVDIDVRDAIVAGEMETLVEYMIGEALLTRFGQRPKRVILFRTAVPFEKIGSAKFVSADCISHHVEVLADGQQFVAFGKHPDTGQDYEWVGGSPLNVPRDQLPELTETKAREIIAAAAEVFRRHGWGEDKKPIPEPKPRANRVHSSIRERKYAEAAVGSMATELSNTMEGSRNDTLNKMAFKSGRMVGAGWIARDTANAVLLDAALESGLSETEARRTLQSGLDAGEKEPHPGLEQTTARKTAEPTIALEPPAGTGAEMLTKVHAFLTRFVSYPSVHAATAHALWCVHAHLMHLWDTTPRLAFLSPEPASGKSRALEVTKQLVPKPVWAVNVSSTYLFRIVGQEGEGSVTLLYDEIDAVFGPKAKENEDTRALLNAGHRKGAVAGRCVARGTIVETEEIPAYAALAVAGLGWLPDTLMSRSIVIRMRPRHSGEPIEPYRPRLHDRQGEMVYCLIEAWAITQTEVTWPDLPEEIKDRDADCWEPLIAVADAAGGEWPALTRRAAKALIKDAKERRQASVSGC